MNALPKRKYMLEEYLELDKNTRDADLIRTHLENIGKAPAAPEPELLELLF